MADTEHDPVAFAEKLRYMRENGGLATSLQGGKAFFKGTTIRTEQQRTIERAKAKGNDVVPYHSVYGN